METKPKWYQRTIVIVLFLIFFFPVGIFLMWKYARWNVIVKIVITIFFAIALLGSFSKSPQTTGAQSVTTPTPMNPTPIVKKVIPTPTPTKIVYPTKAYTPPSPTPTTYTPPAQNGGSIESKNSSGDKDCSDFATHAQAQGYFIANGGSPTNNVNRLDNNHDGIACEDLP